MQKTNLKKTTSMLFDTHSFFHRFKNMVSKEILLKPLLLLLFLGLFVFSQGQQFTVYNSWDFESETLGSYTNAEIHEDFVTSYLLDHNTASIVEDTINNVATKVLQIYHMHDTLGQGFEMNASLGDDYDELYLSYNVKFSEEFNSTAGGKLPGLGGLPDFLNVCPTGTQGFRAHNMHKQAGRIISYHYDRSSAFCPWAVETYDYDTIYFNNGTWYNITQRLVINTFTNGVANADGIKELWVDGRLIFQINNLKFMENEDNALQIDALRLSSFYGGAESHYKPASDCWTYFDNFKIYMPGDDSISGQELHHPSTVLPTPVEITDRTVYYDSLVTTATTLSNYEYGSTYSPCRDEVFLIDAGEDSIANLNITAGSLNDGDYLFFYDGKTTDANIIDMVVDQTFSTGMRTSTSRYMLVRFSTDRNDNNSGWTGTVSFSPTPTPPDPPTNFHVTDSTSTSISMAWTDVTNETQYIVERFIGDAFTTIATLNANTTTYTNTGLTPETTYSYRVKASNSGGDSDYSNVIQVSTEEGGDTTWISTIKVNFTPSGLSGGEEWNDFVTFTSTSSLSLNDSLGNSTGYTLYNEDTWTSSGNGGEITGPYTENVNKTYWYRQTSECDLELRNLDDDNLYSIEVYGSRDTETTRETRITIGSDFDIITVNNNTSDKAIFSYVSPTSGVIRMEVTVETDDFSYVNAIVVREFEISGPEPTIPDTPSGLDAIDSTATTITIGWTDESDNEDKFIIERSQTSGSGFAVIDSVGTDTTSYTDTGLTPETTYYYRIKARNNVGDSGYSNERGVTTLPESATDTTWVGTIKVNFTPSGLSGGEEWNDFVTFTSTSSLSLNDSLGNSTGYTLYNEDTWSAAGNGGEITGPYTENVNKTYWYRQTSECDLELRNLDDDNLYSIEVYGSRVVATTRETRITIGSDFDIITVNNNTSDKAIFPYVSPTSGVIRMEVTVETDIFSYVNAIVVREYEVTGGPTNDTIAKINFMDPGYSESGWTNLTTGDFPANLGDNVSISMSGTLDDGPNGEPTTILPTNVSSSYCFIEYNNETPVVFTVSGLDDERAYSFDFFTSRDDASASGDRTTSFTIGANTVSLNPIGNIDSLLTISDVSPDASGNITITMSKLTNQYGYINAMFIRDIGEKSASISKDDDNKEKLNEPEIKVYPNPGSTMITISGFDEAIELKIVDMLGKVVYQKGYAVKSTQVDISNLKKGLYLIMLKTENNYHLKKFIKN